MLIEEFCREMKNRNPYPFKDAGFLKAYLTDAEEFLKPYQGEILKYAYNIIRMDWVKLPKIAEVMVICKKVNLQDAGASYKKIDGKQVNTDHLVKEFFTTALGKECLKRRVAHQAKDFIEKNECRPDANDCKHFLRVEAETQIQIDNMRKSTGDFAAYIKLGEAFAIKEDEIFEKYNGR